MSKWSVQDKNKYICGRLVQQNLLLYTHVNYSACRGVTEGLLPQDIGRFSGCTVINGDLIFNAETYGEFV